jgi:hypothetical protein
MQMALPVKATMNRHLFGEGNLMQTASASAKPKTEASPEMQTPDTCHYKAVNINDDSTEKRRRRKSANHAIEAGPSITVDKMKLFNFN